MIERIDNHGDRLIVHWSDGELSAYHALWLRDNCACPNCRHAGNDQRLFEITDLPVNVRIEKATLDDAGNITVRFAPEGHLSRFDPNWLRAHRYADRPPSDELQTRRLWDAGIQDKLPIEDHGALVEDTVALARWLGYVRDYGVALVRGVPRRSGLVTEVAELFGYVRETNYGRYFEVRAEPAPINLAYTDMGLPVHTDNPYRDPVPGLQLLHCLTSESEGGESVVVDGFTVAQTLRREAPEHFEFLTRYSVPFRFRDRSVDLRARGPLISVNENGALMAVRYNNRSIGALDVPADVMEAFYCAYRHFAEILQRPALEVTFKLESGDLFVVDNRRVLHGRKQVTSGGARHLQGCYADHDAVDSTYRMLRTREGI